MGRERFIENNVIRNHEATLGIRNTLFIRRSRIGRGFGVADVVFLPTRGPHRLIIVEAKQGKSTDSKSKVVGQLLMYYAGALQLGNHGIRHLREFAAEHPRAARSLRPKSLRMLSGGISPPDEAWAELCKGKSLRPDQIALYAALDSDPGPGLKGALSELARHHDLTVGVISVPRADELTVWYPS